MQKACYDKFSNKMFGVCKRYMKHKEDTEDALIKGFQKVFEKTEPYPAEVACNVHPWMKSYLLIRDNPYMAKTGKDGSFEIKNLPAGKLEFIFWHESKGVLRSVAVGDTKTDRKGRAKLTIPAGETLDLGDIKVSAKALGK